MARDKKVDPADAPESFDDLPELTPKQMEFVRGMLAGRTASDAYRTAYDAENMSDRAIWVEASVLKAHPDVTLWLTYLRRQGLSEARVTLERHLAELDSLATEARHSGNYGAAVKATELMGRASGLYVDRIETKNVGSEAEMLAALRTLPAPLRHEMAQAYGVEHLLDDETAATQH